MALGQRICHPEGSIMSGVEAVIVVARLAAPKAVVNISGLLCRQFQQANLFRRSCELVHSSCKGQYRRFLVSRSLNIGIGLIVVSCSC